MNEDNNSLEEIKEYFEKVNKEFLDDKIDTSLQSSFIVENDKCTHKLERVIDDFGEVLHTATYDYNDYIKKEFIIRGVISHSKRNPLGDVQILPNPKNTKEYNVYSYSKHGNILIVNNIDTAFAKEIEHNIKRIPPSLYEPKKEDKDLKESGGYAGVIQLGIIVVCMMLLIGIYLTMEILS